MNIQEYITLEDNTKCLCNIKYEVITPEIIQGGHDVPNYVDDTENSFISISLIEPLQATGSYSFQDILKVIQDEWDEFCNEIIEKLTK